MDADARLAATAENQHGIFALRQAAAAGLSAAQIQTRREAGLWTPVFHSAYRIAGAPDTWKGRLLAACWAGGFRAVASHRSAAAIWGLPGSRRQPVEITCPRWRRAQHDDLIVHESKALERVDLDIVDGIPVTAPELTLLQLAAVCHVSVVEMAVDVAENGKLVNRRSLEAMLRRLGKQGRNGAGVLRALLASRDPTRKPAESPMETRVIQALRKRGLPEPVPQFDICWGGEFVARVDLAYPRWKIAIEYDSDEHHGGALAHRRDATRRSRIATAGWLPLTATLDDVRGGCVTLCAAVTAARDRAS